MVFLHGQVCCSSSASVTGGVVTFSGMALRLVVPLLPSTCPGPCATLSPGRVSGNSSLDPLLGFTWVWPPLFRVLPGEVYVPTSGSGPWWPSIISTPSLLCHSLRIM